MVVSPTSGAGVQQTWARPALRGAFCLQCGLWVVCFALSAKAQPVSPADPSDAVPIRSESIQPPDSLLPITVPELNAEERERQFAELDAEVESLERYALVLRKVVHLATPSVVHIEAKFGGGQDAQGRRRATIEEAGSGVIVWLDGRPYVITNRHVIQDAAPAQIQLRLHDGRPLSVQRIRADRSTDVAVLYLAEADVIPARLGDSGQVDIGDFVLAVGSPFGLSHSVTYGIVSAKGRRDLELGNEGVRLQDFLQTDAAINPGNSGGPLLSLRGEVIGINTAIASSSGGSEGIGFAIPINIVMFVARQLVEQGTVSHAYLGVRLENAFGPDLAQRLGVPYARGALVKSVTPQSPADLAHLREDDLIVKFNQIDVEDDAHLVNLVSLTPIGDTIALQIIRDGRPFRLSVQVGDRGRFEND